MVVHEGRRKSPEIISHSAMKLLCICITGMAGPHSENVFVTGMCQSQRFLIEFNTEHTSMNPSLIHYVTLFEKIHNHYLKLMYIQMHTI